MDFSTGGFLIGGGLSIWGDHLFFITFFWGQRGLINTARIINTNLTLKAPVCKRPCVKASVCNMCLYVKVYVRNSVCV